MELHQWAHQILSGETLEEKLHVPQILTDDNPGPAKRFIEPARLPSMRFQKKKKEEKLPSFHDHDDPYKRAVCLHRFANHELLAVEIMAYTLLAFPDAPKTFRKGLAHVMKEEQTHVKLYMNRMAEMQVRFGDLPLYQHFWKHTPHITSPLHYVSMMSLTFEMANLDFAPVYGKSFLTAGDIASSELMATIWRDEVNHVRFGWQWFKRWKDDTTGEWEEWQKILSTTLLNPKRARGFFIHKEPRLNAGISQDFINKLSAFK